MRAEKSHRSIHSGPLPIHSGSAAVVFALATGISAGAFSLGFSPLAISLLAISTMAVGCWAFVTEP